MTAIAARRGSQMQRTGIFAALLAMGGLITLAMNSSAADSEPAQMLNKVGNAIERGAEKTARGVERGLEGAAEGAQRGARAAGDGIERGAKATVNAVERGADATARALDKAADKVDPE